MRTIRLAVGAIAVAAAGGVGWAPSYAGKPGGGGGTPGPEEIAIAVARRDGRFDLAVTDAAGTAVRTVVAAAGDGSMRTSWSPDRTRIAFSGTVSGTGVYVVNADGSGLTRLVATTGAPTRVAWSPKAAPDGNPWILFDDEAGGGNPTYGNSDLFVVSPSGGAPVRLTGSTDRSEVQAAWNKDADTLAIVQLTYPGGATEVRTAALGVVGGALAITSQSPVTDVSGSALRGRPVHALDWARTTNRLAISATPAAQTDPDLWVVDLADLARPRNLTNTSGTQERGPSWSADDSWIAFWAPGGKTTVRKIPADGSAAATTVRNDARWPDWRR